MDIGEISSIVLKIKVAAQCNFELEYTKKNTETIINLGFTREDVFDVIMDLESSDFVEGPLQDKQGYKGEFWVFGKFVQDREIYIKVKIRNYTLNGEKQLTTLCISFHYSERPLIYHNR